MTHSHGEQCRQIEWFGPLRFLTLPRSCSITSSGTRLRGRTRGDCYLLSFQTGLTEPRQRANQKKNTHSILHPRGELYRVINEIVWPFLKELNNDYRFHLRPDGPPWAGLYTEIWSVPASLSAFWWGQNRLHASGTPKQFVVSLIQQPPRIAKKNKSKHFAPELQSISKICLSQPAWPLVLCKSNKLKRTGGRILTSRWCEFM